MLNGKKTAELIWLNWEEMMDQAEKGSNPEAFFELPSNLNKDVTAILGSNAILSWNPDDQYDLVDEGGIWRGALDVVSFKIDNDKLSRQTMVSKLLELSKQDPYRKIMFTIIFHEGEAAEKTFVCDGSLTSILIDYESERLIRAF